MQVNDKLSNTQNYYIPDERWNILYQISSREAFEMRFVVKGKFHKLVPDDIIKDFEIAERLMAYSYYCYPMYDEALKKLLGMTEMAVKLRCKQLEIGLEYKDRNGKVKQRILSQLIDLLLTKDKNKPLKEELTKARRVRNIFAHPDRHSFFGGMIYHSITQVINTINFIFLEDKLCKETRSYFEELRKSSLSFEHGNFIFENNENRYLAYGGKCLEAHRIDNQWIGLWVIYPVITNIRAQVEEHKYAPLFYLALKNVEITDNNIVGIDLDSNSTIKLYSTEESTNLETLSTFRRQLKECKRENINLYLHWINEEMGKKLVLHRYNYYWLRQEIDN